MLRVHLFGRPRLLLDEIAFAVGGRPKVIPLLAYILLRRGAPASRRAIAAALWPDEPEEEARANLRRHLNYLQGMLPEAPHDRPWILTGGGSVQWNAACAVWLDVAEFERLAATPHRLHDAIALYTDALLPGVDEEWLEPERERLASLYHHTLASLVSSLRAARDYGGAIAAAQRLLADDPWREDTLRTLMVLRYESGDRAGALAEYERFATMLRTELDAEPMPETSAAYHSLVRDEPDLRAVDRDEPHPSNDAALGALPFVGRAAELTSLRAAWDAAARGHGSLVFIGGEAGVGKSRLVREFAVQCETGGALVYRASTAFPEALPYQPFVTLLRAAAPLLANVAIDPVWLGVLTAFAPALAEFAPEVPPPPPVEAPRERRRLFDAYANVWEAIGARRPVVLVVEDVHWAGSATLELLEDLARRAAEMRVLVVATYREDELALDHRLRTIRRRLARVETASHVALSRLSRDDVGEIVAALGDSADGPALARLVYDRSEGNAFFIDEILRELAETGALRVGEGTWSFDATLDAALPRAVRVAVAARFARLDDRAKRLAEVAAVVGSGFDVELLRETTGWPEASVLDALQVLVDRRIVGEYGGRAGFDFAFGHQLIQAVVYEGITEAVRERRHRRVAHVMEALYSEQYDDVAAEIALHWDRGGEPERATAEYVAAARRALAVYGNDEAERYLNRALELTSSPTLRFEALLLHERIADAAGNRDAQARDAAELSLIAAELGDEDAICTVLERRLEMTNLIGDRRRERVLLGMLQRRVRRSGDVRWQARALEARARYLRAINDFAGARRAFAELGAFAKQIGDRGAHVNARLAVADSYIYEGRLDDAHGVLNDLRAAVELEGSQSALVRTLLTFSRAALIQQDYATMSRHALEAHDISRAIGDREGEALALHTLANGYISAFRVREAGDAYRRALDLYERMHHRVGLASISVDYGLYHTELGLLDRALELFARAAEISTEIGFRFVACVTGVNLSYCRRLRGDFDQAVQAAQHALAIAREIGSAPLESAALGVLGAAECGLGAYDDAVTHLRTAVDLRRPAGATPRLGDNVCALVRALLGAGDLAGARAASKELLVLYDAHPDLPPQPTEWLWSAAQVELAFNRVAPSDELLRRARAVMHERAAAIDDAATRAAFLALPFNRAVARGTRPAVTAAPRTRG